MGKILARSRRAGDLREGGVDAAVEDLERIDSCGRDQRRGRSLSEKSAVTC
jgi:hypothetical protein